MLKKRGKELKWRLKGGTREREKMYEGGSGCEIMTERDRSVQITHEMLESNIFGFEFGAVVLIEF